MQLYLQYVSSNAFDLSESKLKIKTIMLIKKKMHEKHKKKQFVWLLA